GSPPCRRADPGLPRPDDRRSVSSARSRGSCDARRRGRGMDGVTVGGGAREQEWQEVFPQRPDIERGGHVALFQDRDGPITVAAAVVVVGDDLIVTGEERVHVREGGPREGILEVEEGV